MSFDPSSQEAPSGGYEPLHEVAMMAVQWLTKSQGPLVKSQADELVAVLRAQKDEDLGDALTSLTRVAGYFHTRLDAPAIAAQLLEVCYEVTPDLQAAAERLMEKRWALAQARARAMKRVMAGELDEPRRAPLVGDKPQISVLDLKPRTKFS